MPDFFCVIEKNQEGGYAQIFGVYLNNITVWGGGGLCQIFLCVLGGGDYTQIFGVYSKNTGEGGGAMLNILCVTKATSYQEC